LQGLGIRNPIYRLGVAFFPPLAFIRMRKILADAGTRFRLLRGSCCSAERFVQRVDLVFIFSPVWVGALAYYGVGWAQLIWYATMPLCMRDTSSVLSYVYLCRWSWILPNVWRHACIALLSSYSHCASNMP
jgi:hypothetical protein